MEPSATPAPLPNNEGQGPVPLQKENLPSSALLHMRPDTMPAPTSATAPIETTPLPTPSFRPEPIAPPPPPEPLPPREPVYAPPVITPSVFETKPGLRREKKKRSMKGLLLSVLIPLIVLVVVLYFWGAHLIATEGI